MYHVLLPIDPQQGRDTSVPTDDVFANIYQEK